MAALKVADIDLNRGLVRVEEGKGGAERTAYLNDYAREVLRLYIERVRALIFTDWHRRNNDLLFGTRWDRLYHLVNDTLKEVTARLSLGEFSSHGFRHALGYHLLRAGCNIRHIQEILGHKLLRNTEIYTKVDKEDLRNILDTHHPRRFKERGEKVNE